MSKAKIQYFSDGSSDQGTFRKAKQNLEDWRRRAASVFEKGSNEWRWDKEVHRHSSHQLFIKFSSSKPFHQQRHNKRSPCIDVNEHLQQVAKPEGNTVENNGLPDRASSPFKPRSELRRSPLPKSTGKLIGAPNIFGATIQVEEEEA
jgi:hypothetical protein